MARKRLGRRERALAKAIAARNDAIVRHNSQFMDEVKAEARALQTLRSTFAYNVDVCLSRTHVNSRLIYNVKGCDTLVSQESLVNLKQGLSARTKKTNERVNTSLKAEGKILRLRLK